MQRRFCEVSLQYYAIAFSVISDGMILSDRKYRLCVTIVEVVKKLIIIDDSHAPNEQQDQGEAKQEGLVASLKGKQYLLTLHETKEGYIHSMGTSPAQTKRTYFPPRMGSSSTACIGSLPAW